MKKENNLKYKKINWFPGHMKKTISLVKENLKLIDKVLIVVDARVILSSYIKSFEDIFTNKEIIYVITKIDLVDNKMLHSLIKDSYIAKRKFFLINNKASDSKKKLLAYLSDNKNETRAIIVGLPNSGKSTLINSLVRKKSLNTGNKAGVTKKEQWVKLGDNLKFLDTPGVIYPSVYNEKFAYNLALSSAFKDDILDFEELCKYYLFEIILTNFDHFEDIFTELYSINKNKINDLIKKDDILSASLLLIEYISKKRGCILKNSEIDYEKVYGFLINDYRAKKHGDFLLDSF